MESKHIDYKKTVIIERMKGKSYGEICNILNVKIPKSTLSLWCSNAKLPHSYQNRIKNIIAKNSEKARLIALEFNKQRRLEYLSRLEEKNRPLLKRFDDKDIRKIALALLYLGEGGKNRHGSLYFGNSDFRVIKIFLSLIRSCFKIDESKFRCTVQCRADQDIPKLEKFWLKITEIPKKQFYHSRIDPRTIGKPTKKLNYMGVCRVEYFSANIYNELMAINRLISQHYLTGPVV